MNDHEFENLIDARFPYADEREWKRMVDLGRSISPNAHFITLHEICRPPQSAGVTVAQQAEMVRYWAADFEHPLKPIMVGFAVARIEGRSLPVEYVIRVMDEIAHHHKGEWGALAIALSGRDDEDGVADARFDEIKASWEYDG